MSFHEDLAEAILARDRLPQAIEKPMRKQQPTPAAFFNIPPQKLPMLCAVRNALTNTEFVAVHKDLAEAFDHHPQDVEELMKKQLTSTTSSGIPPQKFPMPDAIRNTLARTEFVAVHKDLGEAARDRLPQAVEELMKKEQPPATSSDFLPLKLPTPNAVRNPLTANRVRVHP